MFPNISQGGMQSSVYLLCLFLMNLCKVIHLFGVGENVKK